MLCQKPHPEKCAKNPTQKKTGLTGKSQGQIFQECVECVECQGQISQGQIFQECVECQGQISQGQMGNHKKPEKTGFNWKNRKNGK